VAALALAACVAPAANTGDALAPFRELARSAAAARLLAEARAAMRAYWGEVRGAGEASRTAPGGGAAAAAADSGPLPDWPGPPVGLYVSLVRGRETRACVGSLTPTRGTLVESVRSLAAEALHADRRKPPVRREELDSLRVVIAFAGPPEGVADPMQVDPGREGLLVQSAQGSMAFIPGEARTVSWALRQARRAGVLPAGLKDASFYRFLVVSLGEPSLPPAVKEDRHEEP
jgi:hypothetical protein